MLKINDFLSQKLKTFNKPKSRATIFVHTDTDLSALKEKKDLILSPAFYWSKKEELAFFSLKKARKIAKSVFSSSLPQGNYKFLTTKEQNQYYFFAYNEKQILESLKSLGLKDEFLGDIFFAQDALRSTTPIKINDKLALCFDENIAFLTPLQLVTKYVELTQTLINPDKKRVKLGLKIARQDGNRTFLWLNAFLVIWIICFVSLGIKNTSYLNSQEQIAQDLNTKYLFGKTSFELEAIKNQYKKISDFQDGLKTKLSDISSLNLDEKNHFEFINFDKNTMSATFVYEQEKKDFFMKILQKLSPTSIETKDDKIILKFEL